MNNRKVIRPMIDLNFVSVFLFISLLSKGENFTLNAAESGSALVESTAVSACLESAPSMEQFPMKTIQTFTGLDDPLQKFQNGGVFFHEILFCPRFPVENDLLLSASSTKRFDWKGSELLYI